MRKITSTIKAELPFGTVAVACPSAPELLWQHVWAPALQLKPSGELGFGSEFGGFEFAGVEFGGLGLAGIGFAATGESGPVGGLRPISGSGTVQQQLTTVNIAGPAEAGRTDLYRPFYAMSRRDPRAWRPPTD